MLASHRHSFGMVRREFLQVGFSGFLGLGLPGLLRQALGRGRRSAAGAVGDPGLPHRRAQPPRHVRHEARRARTGSGASSSRSTPAVPGIRVCEHLPGLRGPGRPAGDRPVDVAPAHQPPERDPPDPDRPSAAGRVLRQGRLARRLSRATPRRSTTSGPRDRRHARRRDAADVPDGGAADLARASTPASSARSTTPGRSRQDPNRPDFRVDSLSLPAGFSVERLGRRRSLARRAAVGAGAARPPAIGDPFADQRNRPTRSCSRARWPAPSTSTARTRRRPRPLRPAHVRPVAAAGPAAGRGRRADRPGQHGPRPDLGHALGQLPPAQGRPPAADRPGRLGPARRPGRDAACSTRRWS